MGLRLRHGVLQPARDQARAAAHAAGRMRRGAQPHRLLALFGQLFPQSLDQTGRHLVLVRRRLVVIHVCDRGNQALPLLKALRQVRKFFADLGVPLGRRGRLSCGVRTARSRTQAASILSAYEQLGCDELNILV